MSSPNIIGLDPGFGNYKVCVDGETTIIQTAVSRPRNVGLAGVGMKSAGAKVPVVSIDGDAFAVGTGAWTRGDPLTSLDFTALVAPERLALFYAALGDLADDLTDALLVIGLPVTLLLDKEQAQAVISSLRSLKGKHAFRIDGVPHKFSVAQAKVVAQPVGAYIDWLYDDKGNLRTASASAEVAVIDIGLNTLDLYVVANGRVVESFLGGAEVGVHRLLRLLASRNGRDLTELDADLRSGAMHPDSRMLDAWLGEILAAIHDTLPNLRRFSIVVPTGGGALVLGERLRSALAAKGAAVHWPPDPLTSNVRGFWKYGLKSI